MSIAISELRFLSSPYGQEQIRLGRGLDQLALAKKCSHLSLEQRRALSEFLALEGKLVKKFGVHGLLADTLAYEQSTAVDLAEWKCSLVPNHSKIADLCCGMGADSMFLNQTQIVAGVDLSIERLEMFQHNHRLIRSFAPSYSVLADVTQFPLTPFDFWFCDPDRRGGHRYRQWDLSQLRPSLDQIDRMLNECPRGFLKLPPSTDIGALDWRNACFYLLGDRKSCRELLVQFDPQIQGRHVQCVHVDSGQSLRGRCLHRTRSTDARIGSWIFEPSPVAIRSELFLDLAQELGLWQRDPNIPYLFGSKRIDHEFLNCFEILLEMPYDLKVIAKYLKDFDAGEVIVKKRGVECDPDLLAKKWKSKGSKALVVFVTKVGAKSISILAKKSA